MTRLEETIASLTGAARATRRARIQSLWGGYGEAARFELAGARWPSVVVKHIDPGHGSGRSHARKLRSYEVEQAWYSGDYTARCGPACRVATCIHAGRHGDGWIFILEDLDAAGFTGRGGFMTQPQRDACLRWLAAFHASFMGEPAGELWPVGTYWHLETRPDELRAMPHGPLRAAAAAIDAALSGARYKTLVHGDAKPANFCFDPRGGGVAAVDFQYVGGGCGVKDVAYLLVGDSEEDVHDGLEVYFEALGEALRARGFDASAVEEEWRGLYPLAWADFERFLAGWSPGWRINAHEAAMTRRALKIVGRG